MGFFQTIFLFLILVPSVVLGIFYRIFGIKTHRGVFAIYYPEFAFMVFFWIFVLAAIIGGFHWIFHHLHVSIS